MNRDFEAPFRETPTSKDELETAPVLRQQLSMWPATETITRKKEEVIMPHPRRQLLFCESSEEATGEAEVSPTYRATMVER